MQLTSWYCVVSMHSHKTSATTLFEPNCSTGTSTGIRDTADSNNRLYTPPIYLKDQFLLHLSAEDAGKTFRSWIYESLYCKTTQINNAIHIMAH